jgi:hypothetical protein
MALTQVDQGLLSSTAQYTGFKNRIINGAQTVDQRGSASTAVTTSSAYVTDRFTQVFANASCSFQQVSDAPSGFINSLKLTVTTGSAPSVGSNNVILQKIEGLNVFDFVFGSASAVSVTLSFWVKGSVTGTYAVSLTNSAFNRSYVATYTINVANTWEQKTITVAGDTTGTWLTTNGVGLTVLWDFGSGTNLNTTAGSWQAGNYYRTSGCTTIASTTNATFQITGVQLEKGSTATSFDYRPYGTELALCQRYFVELMGGTNAYQSLGLANTYSTTQGSYVMHVPVPMRTATPSLTTVGNVYLQNLGNVNISAFAGPYSQKGTIVEGDITMASAVTANQCGFMRFNNVNTATAKFNFSAEL